MNNKQIDMVQQAGAGDEQAVSLIVPPVWADRLRTVAAASPAPTEPVRVIPRAPNFYIDRVTPVVDTAGAAGLVDFARQRPLSCVGIDFEFRYSRPGVPVGRRHGKDLYWNDPRSVVPLLMAITLVEPGEAGPGRLYQFVIDCRLPETVAPLAALFRLPIRFAAHFAQAELFCLWQLGLPVPDMIWDTWAAERAFILGIYHARNAGPAADEAAAAEAKEQAEDAVETSCALVAVCGRRGDSHSFAAAKSRLQESFLDHPPDTPFTTEQIEYAAADATAAARLYPVQVQVALANGSLSHLDRVEMDWAVTNARMIWDGVRVSRERCSDLLAACDQHRQRLAGELAVEGVENVKSHPQMVKYFDGLGLLDNFRVWDGYSFDDDHLKAVEKRLPAVRRVRTLRRVGRMLTDKSLTGELTGADGRLHPDHRQLGAETGRNTMRWPNLGGIGRKLRPVVVPDEGYGLGEVDLSQIEPGIAAAWYGDPNLIKMFNSRDVYVAMCRSFYAAELPPNVKDMPDEDFKKVYEHLRNRMKVFTLATIYNITPHGLALQLGISDVAAAREQEKFMAMFPALAVALQEASAYGIIRGFADTVSGLRRWRARSGPASTWEVNWMRNVPVQGSASMVFKVAGNRLYRRYQHLGARLVLPMHDAFLFEAPRDVLNDVARVTEQVMIGAVQEFFPALNPQVSVNVDDPTCWNKDGQSDSLARWIDDPMG